MSKNSNLGKAKKAKNDEFYTQLTDINKEIKHYKNSFKDKIVFCNCDDPSTRNGGKGSNFYTYFVQNFNHLGLKKLITTHFVENGVSYKNEITKKDFSNGGNGLTPDVALEGNGDFRSDECINLLEESDIVVTNPPFSLFPQYMSQLMKYNKKFLIIGPLHALKKPEIFPYIKNDQLWIGNSGRLGKFLLPNGESKGAPALWYTNLENKRKNEELILHKTYNKEEYPSYDEYDAIEVGFTKLIPMDYKGKMGVPISFLEKHNSNQFELIGASDLMSGKVQINGESPFSRIIIKRK